MLMEAFSLVTWATVIGALAIVVAAIYAVLHYQHDRNASTQSPPPSDKSSIAEVTETLQRDEFIVTSEVRTAFHIGPPKSLGVQLLHSISRSLFKIEEEGYGGFTVRNFDWDGNSTVLRPCDVHLGYDKWDIRSGNHLESYEFSKDSFATLYSVLLVGGVFFGNGSTVVFKPKYKPREILPIQLNAPQDGFGITRDRKVLAVVTKDGSKVAILNTDYNGSFQFDLVDTTVAEDSYDEKGVYFSPFQGLNRSFYVFQQQSSMEDSPPQAITRHDFESRQQTASIRVKGLQNIALTPDGNSLVAVCTEQILRLNATDLSVLERVSLVSPREHERYMIPPAQFSPCGNYLAMSYNISGDVEIRDATTLDIVTKVPTHGLAAAPLKWSSDGRYLAGGFRRRTDEKPQLYIWLVSDASCVAVVEDVLFFSPSRPHCSNPGSFYWHASKAELLLLLENGRIQRLEHYA